MLVIPLSVREKMKRIWKGLMVDEKVSATFLALYKYSRNNDYHHERIYSWKVIQLTVNRCLNPFMSEQIGIGIQFLGVINITSTKYL